MASAVTVGLVVAATVASGLLAGLNVDRLIVQMPAWEEVGALAWASYSREADLGNGLILYLLEAIGGAILTAAAAVAFHFDRAAPRLYQTNNELLTIVGHPVLSWPGVISEPGRFGARDRTTHGSCVRARLQQSKEETAAAATALQVTASPKEASCSTLRHKEPRDRY